MCKVYEFPAKNNISEYLEKRLDKIVREFVSVINESFDTLYDGDPTEQEYSEFMEAFNAKYTELLAKAINELEWGPYKGSFFIRELNNAYYGRKTY